MTGGDAPLTSLCIMTSGLGTHQAHPAGDRCQQTDRSTVSEMLCFRHAFRDWVMAAFWITPLLDCGANRRRLKHNVFGISVYNIVYRFSIPQYKYVSFFGRGSKTESGVILNRGRGGRRIHSVVLGRGIPWV